MQQININELKSHPRNNEFFDDMSGEKWTEFLSSIKSRGVIEPVVITPDKTIVSGHQRVRACKELGVTTVMCNVHTYDNEDQILHNMIYSNINRIKHIESTMKKSRSIYVLSNFYQKIIDKIKDDNKKIEELYRADIKKIRSTIINLNHGKCNLCGITFNELLDIHHILPLSNGGNNANSNIICLCPNCHRIIHKYIALFNQETEDMNLFDEWIKNIYSVNAYERLLHYFKQYLIKKGKYGYKYPTISEIISNSKYYTN